METASRPVNLHRKATGKSAPAIYDRLDNIQNILELQKVGRRRDQHTQRRFRECLRALCLDLFDAYQSDRELALGIRRDKTGLTKNPAYPEFVTARPFLDALNGLMAMGYVEQLSLGTESSGKSTRIRATGRLVTELTVHGFKTSDVVDTSDPIRLNVGSKGRKKRLPFEDTEDTKRWRRNIHSINENNNCYELTLELSEREFTILEQRRHKKATLKAQTKKRPLEYHKVDFHRTKLHRVFNKVDWSEGGRFYGAWWQTVPKEYRKHIRINGKDTCEFDYSGIHLRLLYQHAERPMVETKDPYSQPYGEQHREAVKRAFNVMLNASGKPKEVSVPEFKSAELGMTWHAFLDGIVDCHSDINEYFYTGFGGKLQRLDADIAEAMLLKLASMQYPCLPIHDSFITYATLKDEVPEIMVQIAKDHGVENMPAKVMYVSEYLGATGLVDMDIADLL